MTAVLQPQRSFFALEGTRFAGPESLLFSFELNDGTGPSTSSSHLGEQARAASVKQRLNYLISSSTSSLSETRLLRDVRAFQAAVLREEGCPDTVVLASKLAAVGYALTIRTALGGGSGRACFHNLHHEFLLVSGGPDCGPAHQRDIIVDPHFREQFEIPQPSDAYAELVAALPAEWVGCARRLVPLVQLLCEEMGAAFEARAMTCPPWRQARAMLSKWLPAKVRDVGVSSPRGGGGGGGRDRFDDLVSAGISPTTPLEHYGTASPPLLPGCAPPPPWRAGPEQAANSERSAPGLANWWVCEASKASGPAAECGGGGGGGGGSPTSPDSMGSGIKLERSTSLLSRNLASKASAADRAPGALAVSGGAAAAASLAAKLQGAVLDSMLAQEQPPIRRVKMIGALGLDKAPASTSLVAV